jgi:hypothetical protein
MTAEDKKRLIELLTESHSGLHEAIEGLDPGRRIYKDSGWQIRDIIGHLATWVRQVTKSFRAFQAGNEYVITHLDIEEHSFNEQAVKEQRTLTAEQVYEQWEQACEEVIDALQDIPKNLFPGDLLFPWGDERGSIAELVEFLIDHDAEHLEEIVLAIQKD